MFATATPLQVNWPTALSTTRADIGSVVGTGALTRVLAPTAKFQCFSTRGDSASAIQRVSEQNRGRLWISTLAEIGSYLDQRGGAD